MAKKLTHKGAAALASKIAKRESDEGEKDEARTLRRLASHERENARKKGKYG